MGNVELNDFAHLRPSCDFSVAVWGSAERNVGFDYELRNVCIPVSLSEHFFIRDRCRSAAVVVRPASFLSFSLHFLPFDELIEH